MRHAEQPYLHRWSCQAYGRLVEHGVLDEDDPVELLDGLLLVKEPRSSPRRTAVLLAAKTLVVEIAQSSLRLARGRNAAAYARAGIADYWIVASSPVCWKSIGSRRGRARRAGAGATWRWRG